MNLRQIRKALGIPQRQAAMDLGVSPTVLNRYENGTRQPSNAFLVEAAKYYQTTTDAILGNESGPEEGEAPKTIEAKILASGIDKMPERDRERALNMVKLMFEQYADFFRGGNNDDDT